VATAITQRKGDGSSFSIVAVAEGAVNIELATQLRELKTQRGSVKGPERAQLKSMGKALFAGRTSTFDIAKELEERTRLESRVTILGHVQRGGTPSPSDRILATTLGAAATESIANEQYGVMIASKGDGYRELRLSKVAGRRKMVPIDHPRVRTARSLGICMGDSP
jgi:6-phosphofructokinase